VCQQGQLRVGRLTKGGTTERAGLTLGPPGVKLHPGRRTEAGPAPLVPVETLDSAKSCGAS
jgi:hypothetical protein